MKHTPLCQALALAACLVLAAPAWSAKHEPAPSPLAGLSEARKLVAAGRHGEALTILRPLTGGPAVDANALFLFGVAAMGASQMPGVADDRRDDLLDEAIAVFRRMLVDRPDLVRVRLELARAFFLKGKDPLARLRGADALAREHFERVLAGNPPAGVALNVNRFLAQIRARKDWSAGMGVALAPDSNLAARTDEDRILLNTPFGQLPFEWQGDKPRSGIGVAMWASGEYQYPVAREWRIRAGGNLSRREYRSDEYDRMTLAGHLGPRWLVGRYSEASVLASARQSWLSDEAEYRDLGVRAEGRHRLGARTVASLGVSRHERRYEEADHLDGPLTDVSLGLGWVATPTVRIDTAGGWSLQRTELKRQRNSSHWLRLGASVQLPHGFTVGGAGTLRWTAYRGDWSPYVLGGGPRSDVTRLVRLYAHNRAFTVAGFSPQVSLVQEVRTSNAQLHGYDRISGELGLVRQF